MAGRTSWLVPSHRPLEQLADGLWSVQADVPGLPIGRRMIVARLTTGELIVHSAVCADEATMTTLAAAGPIAYVIVPCAFHRLDAAAFKHRFPTARIVARPAAAAAVSKMVAVDGDVAEVPFDAGVSWQPLAGVAQEGVLLHHARDEGGAITAVFNDAFFNLPDRLPGVRGKIMGLVGSTGGPKVTRIARTFLVGDARAYADQLRTLAALPTLRRVVPGHGAVLDGAAAVAGLRRAADNLHAAQA